MKIYAVLVIALFGLTACPKNGEEAVGTGGQLLEGKPLSQSTELGESLALTDCLKKTLADKKNLEGELDIVFYCSSIEESQKAEVSKGLENRIESEHKALVEYKKALELKLEDKEASSPEVRKELNLTNRMIERYETAIRGLGDEGKQRAEKEEAFLKRLENLSHRGVSLLQENQIFSLNIDLDEELEEDEQKKSLEALVLNSQALMDAYKDFASFKETLIDEKTKIQMMLIETAHLYFLRLVKNFSSEGLQTSIEILEALELPTCNSLSTCSLEEDDGKGEAPEGVTEDTETQTVETTEAEAS